MIAVPVLAAIQSAGISIIAIDGIARIRSDAGIRVDATQQYIAEINGARVSVIAVDWSMRAANRAGTAAVKGACIIVVTGNLRMLANSIEATVVGASVKIIAIYRSENATRCTAGVRSAQVAIIAGVRIILTLTVYASIACAWIRIIAINLGGDAAGGATRIGGAQIPIIA